MHMFDWVAESIDTSACIGEIEIEREREGARLWKDDEGQEEMHVLLRVPNARAREPLVAWIWWGGVKGSGHAGISPRWEKAGSFREASPLLGNYFPGPLLVNSRVHAVSAFIACKQAMLIVTHYAWLHCLCWSIFIDIFVCRWGIGSEQQGFYFYVVVREMFYLIWVVL